MARLDAACHIDTDGCQRFRANAAIRRIAKSEASAHDANEAVAITGKPLLQKHTERSTGDLDFAIQDA
jgi:hypothetical protein